MTMKSDGSERRKYNGAEPLHQTWYDGNTLMGVEHNFGDRDKKIHRFDLDGKEIELLTGHACHYSSTDDRELYAGESYYGNNPISLKIYKKGVTGPIKTVFTTRNTDVVWKGKAHINPTFSKNKKRLYFNYPEDNGSVSASLIELDSNIY